MHTLTKSKYMEGLECLKYLWTIAHHPEKIPEPDDFVSYLLEQGRETGEIAKRLFPSGINVPCAFKENIEKSAKLIYKRKTLFEAGFLAGNIYARTDILEPKGKDEWDIIEVKMSSSVKAEHIQDVAFQRCCLEKAGLKIRKCFLMHIDNKYTRKGKINAKKLFARKDITADVKKELEKTEQSVRIMLEVLAMPECPNHSRCKKGERCRYVETCWQCIPENSVLHLYRGGTQCIELFESGIAHLEEIPEDFALRGHQEIQKKCAATGKQHANKKEISEFLKKIKAPVHFLDFEAINPAIPVFEGTHPYETVPFQFSLHVLDEGITGHFSFIASGTEDPRKELASELKKLIGEKGSIVAYNAKYEANVLKELALKFPEHRKWVESLLPRIVDLLVPFRNFYYYNPKQRGSASLKEVLPAMTGKGYEGLEIAGGGGASLAYIRILSGAVPKEKTRKALEQYCSLDTEAMVLIVEKLRKVAAK